MNSFFMLCVVAVAVPGSGLAYEKAFPATKPGSIEVKSIPEHTLIVAQRGESYFDENNALFRNLFRYISKNDVSMTTPVKADIDPGKMYFYVGSKDVSKDLKDTEQVKVISEPQRSVLSIGVRGSYSEKNYSKACGQLIAHLAESKNLEKTGQPYAIFWHGPYVPGFMKHFEIHIPVKPTS